MSELNNNLKYLIINELDKTVDTDLLDLILKLLLAQH